MVIFVLGGVLFVVRVSVWLMCFRVCLRLCSMWFVVIWEVLWVIDVVMNGLLLWLLLIYELICMNVGMIGVLVLDFLLCSVLLM